jgi:Na+(H+)/acetate symporter ActP
MTFDWGTQWFDANKPVVTVFGIQITRWIIISAIIGFVVWLVFFLMDRNNHSDHKDNIKKLRRKVDQLEERFDTQFPPT